MMLSIRHLEGGGDYITPNLCLNSETWETKCEPEEEEVNLITFTVEGTEYQAEEGMTFYDWAMSEYFDSSCILMTAGGGVNLRDYIIQENVSPSDSISIFYGGNVPLIPDISTVTIIQPISYIPNSGIFDDY